MAINTIIFLTFAALAAAAGQLLFKVGATDAKHLGDFLNVPIFVGLLFYGIGTALWIYALSSELLVNVYAFTALTFVLVYLGGVFLLGEALTLPTFIGVLLVLSGLFLIVSNGSVVK